jgi:uncharacterized RDD family membrane protein YckC
MGGLGLRRLGALTADVVAVGLLAVAALLPFGLHPGTHYDLPQRLISAAVDAVAFGLYVVPFLVRDGTTPGKRLARLRVVMADGGGPPSAGVAVLRDPVVKIFLLGSLLSAINPALGFAGLAIDLAPALWRRDGRTLHDHLAGTVVEDALLT